MACAVLGVPQATPAPVADCQWNQQRGNSASTAGSCVEPILSEPVQAWRHGFDEILSEPVAWSDVVYVAAREGRATKLHAFRIQDGEPLGETSLNVDGSVALAVSQGTVAVVDEEAIRTYTHRGGVFQRGSSLKPESAWVEAPALHAGLLLVLDGARLNLIDLKRLKSLGSVPGGIGRPAIGPAGRDGELLVSTVGYGTRQGSVETFLKLHVARIRGAASETPAFEPEAELLLGAVDSGVSAGVGYAAYVRSDPGGEDKWFARSPRRLKVAAKGVTACHGYLLGLDPGPANIAPLVSDVAIHGGQVFGFSGEGALVRMLPTGEFVEVVANRDLPAGARPGAATLASGVLYLGNWAVELESGRVLWCLADVAPVGGLLPLSDRRAVYATRTSIACLADPLAAAGAAEGGPGSADLADRPAVRPSSGDGVVLADGTFVPGTASLAGGGRVALAGEGGEARTLEAAEVALLVAGEEVVRLGKEYPVFQAFDRALRAEVADRLEALFASYLRTRHLADCRRLLTEAQEYGLEAARARKLEDQLAGKAESRSDNADAQRGKKVEEEAKARAILERAFLDAADWCGARGLACAATVLASETRRIRPDTDRAALAARVRPWVPAEFPWLDQEGISERWMTWAAELLPAGATFCGRDDPVWKRARTGPWQAGAIALRTEHLELLSLEHDPLVVGACLRRGEGTVLALQELLGPPEGPAPKGEQALLQMRLHADRESYLSEELPSGDYAMPWSAGFYSRSERASRFFVPRASDEELLGRDLAEVVAHELTHHYIDQVWLGAASRGLDPAKPGYWIVEGIACYVQDQVLELGRAARRFDDPTVSSLDMAAQADAAGRLLSIEKLVDGTRLDFDQLSDAADIPIQLRFTLLRGQISERALFYQQAASLVFYLMNRRGEQGRAALVTYLRDYYRRRSQQEGWLQLGWPSAQALEQELKVFLGTVRDG